jgi:membrane-bound lytic murein transglycosylase D
MGEDITEKYPAYSYVFSEFDIENEYIYNSDFNEFVHKNEKKLRRFYKLSLKRGKNILPTMHNLLVQEGVSDLFIYLSMVESGFSSSSVSPKKAVGLWQFMPKTAQVYNLSVSETYDERTDTVSSTSAAINYLNKLYMQFKKWYLAAMAYNCGEGRMARAIEKAGTDELSVLLDRDYLPLETQEYIKKILLVALIGESMSFDFYNNMDLEVNEYIEVEISTKTTLKEIASLIKIKNSLLEKLNTNAIKKKTLSKDSKTYKIKIPIEKLFAFYLRYELEKEKIEYKKYHISHVVQLGETLESISKKYNASKEEIKVINKISDTFLVKDKVLIIPVSESSFKLYQ